MREGRKEGSIPGRADAPAGRPPQRGEDDPSNRQLLAARARALARPTSSNAPAATTALLGFSLGGESWSLPARFVWEVFRLSQLAPLPGAEAPVAGLTTWRGSVLAVLDLCPLLGVPAARGETSHVVVIGEEHPAFGILADGLGEVVALEAEAITEPPEGVTTHREWILGVTREAGLVLDAGRLVRHFT